MALGLRVRIKNQLEHWSSEATAEGESGAVIFKMATREPIGIYPLLLRNEGGIQDSCLFCGV